MKITVLLSALFCFFAQTAAYAQSCGGICEPGPGTPYHARGACQMVNSFPANIRANTCNNANGCVWRQSSSTGVCVPGPGTSEFSRHSCNTVNSYPANIRYNTCINIGCVMQETCY